VNPLTPDDRPDDTCQATPAQAILARIETLLEEQWQQVRRGNIDAVHDLCLRVDTLVPQVSKPNGDVADTEARLRLVRLYNKIELALAQRSTEIAQHRARLQAGRTLRKAYGRRSRF